MKHEGRMEYDRPRALRATCTTCGWRGPWHRMLGQHHTVPRHLAQRDWREHREATRSPELT